MINLINIQQTFENESFSDKKISNKEFEDCVFKNCDFSYSDFSFNTFMDCEFIGCNLSNIKLWNSSLKTVIFKNCKLIGIEYNKCEDFLFSISFQDCILDFATFNNKKMPKTTFANCSLKEASFVETNLTQSVFENCDLDNSMFNKTILTAVDFSTAYNYKIDPEFNPMKKAKFTNNGIVGLLNKYDIKIV
jgi:uncharacterized protein YjbI with pentapeptide repeats